jgi:CBS-domain-containing membrane protein
MIMLLTASATSKSLKLNNHIGKIWMDRIKSLQQFLGIEPERVSYTEKFVSALGGFLGILLIAVITYQTTGVDGAVIIVPSMGASAVLLFAVPHGKLSQPWALFGGHIVSALIGVICLKLVGDTFLAASLAVGLAIACMHLLNCIHPPGGATALAAVIGGPAIHELGFDYVLVPIFVNTVVILIVAIGFNAFFPWRRYPASLVKKTQQPDHDEADANDIAGITQDDLDYAMKKIDLLIDITVDDLVKLYALASKHSQSKQLQTSQIKLDHYYSNGLFGKMWQVRHIIDESVSADLTKDKVIYKIMAGPGRRSTGTCTREEFAAWARNEVLRNENSWQRIDNDEVITEPES